MPRLRSPIQAFPRFGRQANSMQEMPDNHPSSTDLSPPDDGLVDPVDLIEVESTDDAARSGERYLKRRIAQQRSHLGIMLTCILVLALSFLLRVRTDQRVEFRIFPESPLPHTCASRAMLGVDCPGCGLTRAFILLAEGDLKASIGVHRIGWVLVLFILFQIPYRIFGIKWPERMPSGPAVPSSIVLVVFILLLGNWIIGFLI